MEVNYISIRHPQTNAAERYMRIIGDMLRIKCFERHNSWVNKLKEIEGYINHSFSSVTGFIPEDVQQGKLGNLPFDNAVKFPDDIIGWNISAMNKENNKQGGVSLLSCSVICDDKNKCN